MHTGWVEQDINRVCVWIPNQGPLLQVTPVQNVPIYLGNVLTFIVPPVVPPDLGVLQIQSPKPGRNKCINKWWVSISMFLNPPPPHPSDTFEALWHSEGMFGGPTQAPAVLWVGCLLTFMHCYPRRLWFGSPPDPHQRDLDSNGPVGCLLCLPAGERGLNLQGQTSQSLLGFPWLYGPGQTDWRPFENTCVWWMGRMY